MKNDKVIQAAKMLLIAVKHGELIIFPKEDSTADYLQILEDAVNAAINATQPKTKVQFLCHEENKDLYAFFPDTNEGVNEVNDELYSCYSTVGQHSSATFEYARESRRATPEEYKDLQKELENIGYNLEII